MNESPIWVELTRTFGLPEAQIIAGQLQAEGIPAKAIPLEAGGRLGITVGKLGEAAVMVPEHRLKEAEDVAFEPLPDNWEDEIEEDPDLL